MTMSGIKEFVLKSYNCANNDPTIANNIETTETKINQIESIDNNETEITKNEIKKKLNLSQSSVESDEDSPTKDTNPNIQKPRASLKDELFGFDTNQFNFVDVDPSCEDF